ncbi:hypothetical protein [[Kitasatospora] papulosa]|uniref:hypothetical protein n=1 Tax=[Kitasatospora] papulosa TaxID=1464011 RepID=UPI0036A7E590
MTPKTNLADALDALGDLMGAPTGSLNHFGLARLMSQVIDGPGASPRKATTNPELQWEMVQVVAPMGFISQVPTLHQVRESARAHRA